VDFGCRVGHYSIPAARLVGRAGQVYAIDKDRHSLSRLAEKVGRLGLTNLRTIVGCDRPIIDAPTCSVDVVLLYDVLHYFDASRRKELLQEAFRVLVPKGLLSVYPKHTLEDSPAKEFMDLSVSGLRREIQFCHFRCIGRYESKMSHDDDLIEGYVLNFRKWSVGELKKSTVLLEMSGCFC
jgi:ubiquinone/menaquinone biosynthesis C-methylase UbiE